MFNKIKKYMISNPQKSAIIIDRLLITTLGVVQSLVIIGVNMYIGYLYHYPREVLTEDIITQVFLINIILIILIKLYDYKISKAIYVILSIIGFTLLTQFVSFTGEIFIGAILVLILNIKTNSDDSMYSYLCKDKTDGMLMVDKLILDNLVLLSDNIKLWTIEDNLDYNKLIEYYFINENNIFETSIEMGVSEEEIVQALDKICKALLNRI